MSIPPKCKGVRKSFGRGRDDPCPLRALIIAGIFTLRSGRIMHDVVFGPEIELNIPMIPLSRCRVTDKMKPYQ